MITYLYGIIQYTNKQANCILKLVVSHIYEDLNLLLNSIEEKN